MSRIKKLITELCSNGVEYKKIDDCCFFQNGYAFKSNLFKSTGDILLRITNINGKAIDLDDVKYIDINDYDTNLEPFRVNYEDIVIAMSGATTGKIGINKTKRVLYLNQRIGKITPKNTKILNNRFLYHVLLTKTNYFYNLAGGGVQPNLSSKAIKNTIIPVPPLEVQKEIVRILDKLGELESELKSELESELESRQSQYQFWNGKIFENYMNCKTRHITDIALVKARVGWQRLTTAEYLNAGDYYLITGTDFKNDGKIDFNNCVYVTKERYEMDKNIQVHKNDILITKDGTLGKVAYLDDEPDKLTTLNSGVFRIKVTDSSVLPRYIYHYFNSKVFKNFIETVKTGSTIPHLTQKKLVSLNIPIPNIEEQGKIINILDKFDSLTRDLSIGLLAEIELISRQYEYYRDMLLTFNDSNEKILQTDKQADRQ